MRIEFQCFGVQNDSQESEKNAIVNHKEIGNNATAKPSFGSTRRCHNSGNVTA